MFFLYSVIDYLDVIIKKILLILNHDHDLYIDIYKKNRDDVIKN
jgi:hypothetical protein